MKIEKYIFEEMKNVVNQIEDQKAYFTRQCNETDDIRNMKIGDKNLSLIRNIISYTLPVSYKFMDKIIWDSNREKCIVIGFNPSISTYSNIDRTNKKMIVALDNVLSFGGYYLLNYYSIVDSDPESVLEDTYSISSMINDSYTKALIKILNHNLSNEQLSVVLMWGPTLSPEVSDKSLFDLLVKYQDLKLLHCTCKKLNDHFTFIHGSGRGVSAKNYFFPLVEKIELTEPDNLLIVSPGLT